MTAQTVQHTDKLRTRVFSAQKVHTLLIAQPELSGPIARELAEAYPEVLNLSSFPSAEQALREEITGVPDVLLVSVSLLGVSGISAIPILKRRWPSASVIVIDDILDEANIVESIRIGASGYLLADNLQSELGWSVLAAARGEFPVSPKVSAVIAACIRKGAVASTHRKKLTEKEISILTLLAKGCSYREVGASLNLSLNTVRNYIRTIYEKLDVNTKFDALDRAFI